MSIPSFNKYDIDGDVNVGRGQLGLGWRGTSASTQLWTLFRGANHYIIDPSTAAITITLPVVGTGSAQAQPGHWVTIANINSGTNVINVVNSASAAVVTITAGNSAKLIADSGSALFWVVQYNTSGYGAATTLQAAYNASGPTTQIVLTATNNSLKINDATVPLSSLFNLQNNAGSYVYFSARNTTAGSQTPAITMLGSTTSAANTLAAINSTTSATNSVGILNSTVSASGSVGLASSTVNSTNTLGFGTITTASGASGSVALCDSSSAYTGYSTPNTFYGVFTGGEQHFGGGVRPGTTRTSPNQISFYVSVNNVTTTGTTINLIGSTSTFVTSLASSTYSITLEIYGRDATSPSTVSARHKLEGLSVTNGTNVPTLIGQTVYTSETPGFTTIPASATFATTATDLTLTLVAPDNVTAPAGAGMDYRIYGEYRVLTI